MKNIKSNLKTKSDCKTNKSDSQTHKFDENVLEFLALLVEEYMKQGGLTNTTPLEQPLEKEQSSSSVDIKESNNER